MISNLPDAYENHLPLLLSYVTDSKIKTSLQMDEAIKYLKTKHPSEELNLSEFENASGIGIIVNDEDMMKAVDKEFAFHLEKIKEERYRFNFGVIIRKVKEYPNLKWADGKKLTQAIEEKKISILGEKTEADLCKKSIKMKLSFLIIFRKEKERRRKGKTRRRKKRASLATASTRPVLLLKHSRAASTARRKNKRPKMHNPIPSRAKRIPAHRARKINKLQLLPRRRLQRNLLSALRRHKPRKRDRRVHQIHRRNSQMAGLHSLQSDLQQQPFRQTLRTSPQTDPQSKGLRLLPLSRTSQNTKRSLHSISIQRLLCPG